MLAAVVRERKGEGGVVPSGQYICDVFHVLLGGPFLSGLPNKL